MEIDAKIFVVEFIAQIRVITKKIPETCEQLSRKVLQAIPKGYEGVDLVANAYSLVSIKTAERNERGSSSKVSIKSVRSKILRGFSLFMQNNKNKSRLIDIIFDFIIENRIRCLGKYSCQEMVIATKTIESSRTRLNHISSNQEEADTKVILHMVDALQAKDNSKIRLR